MIASSGRREQGEMCTICSFLCTCLLSKLARLSSSRCLEASILCGSRKSFQTVPAKIRHDLIQTRVAQTQTAAKSRTFKKKNLKKIRRCELNENVLLRKSGSCFHIRDMRSSLASPRIQMCRNQERLTRKEKHNKCKIKCFHF